MCVCAWCIQLYWCTAYFQLHDCARCGPNRICVLDFSSCISLPDMCPIALVYVTRNLSNCMRVQDNRCACRHLFLVRPYCVEICFVRNHFCMINFEIKQTIKIQNVQLFALYIVKLCVINVV